MADAGSAVRSIGMACALVALAACSTSDGQAQEKGRAKSRLSADTLGAAPASVRRIPIQGRRDLVESSGVTASVRQPGVLFVINDSGNEPLLFALDTTGMDRGLWRVTGVQNADWESISIGRCALGSAGPAAATTSTNECLYIGDTGDNSAKRATRTIHRIAEPAAQRAGFTGSVTPAQSLVYRYSDGPHDVEAMYVAPNGSTFLITKRPLRGAGRSRRPALVFEIPASAWSGTSAPVVAQLVDSLPIVPGTGPRRLITDAALSPDGRRLAVRTYEQLWVFSTDSATGRVVHSTPPGLCYLSSLGRWQGEGVAWMGRGETLVLTAEGRESPMFAVNCPMPNAAP